MAERRWELGRAGVPSGGKSRCRPLWVSDYCLGRCRGGEAFRGGCLRRERGGADDIVREIWAGAFACTDHLHLFSGGDLEVSSTAHESVAKSASTKFTVSTPVQSVASISLSNNCRYRPARLVLAKDPRPASDACAREAPTKFLHVPKERDKHTT
jgi:hypothetical protein